MARLFGATAVSFLLGGCLLAFSPDALACGDAPARCDAPVRLFPSAFVPANLIYFKVLVDDPGELTLRQSDGTVIAADVETIGNDRVFVPHIHLDSGLELELEYTTVCPTGLDPEQVVYSFTTTDSMKLKLQSPSLSVYEQGVRYPGLDRNEAVFTTVDYHTPAADSSSPHLMDHYVTVDGLDYRFGGENLAPTIELSAGCLPEATETPSASCGYVSSFLTGTHHVVAWSTVVGETSEPEKAELDVNLDCSLARAVAGLGGGADDGSGDAGVGASASKGGGCSLSHASHGGQKSSFVGLLGVGVVFLRWRRRRRSRELERGCPELNRSALLTAVRKRHDQS